MVRLQVVLDPTEAEALARWARSELRDLRGQIRFVLQQELVRQGLLPAVGDADAEGSSVPTEGRAHHE